MNIAYVQVTLIYIVVTFVIETPKDYRKIML